MGPQEFDALLVTVDGVPVGGPFNPSLVQVSLDGVDRVEIVKGPQGTLYGVSAFAGMVQVFTHRRRELPLAHAGRRLVVELQRRVRHEPRAAVGLVARPAGLSRAGDGWQDRTHSTTARGRVSLSGTMGKAKVGFDVTGLSDRADWGTPMPVDLADPVPASSALANYAVDGATQEHALFSLGMNEMVPVAARSRFEHAELHARRAEVDPQLYAGVPDESTPDTISFAGVQLRARRVSRSTTTRAS